MAYEIVAEAGKMLGSALAGGLVTAASALPYLNSKLTQLTTEVTLMKESNTTYQGGITADLATLRKKVDDHHTDDDKHYTKASDKLLNDILERVMRIESRLFNGHRYSDD